MDLAPKFISISEVREIHADQISSFGGSPGVRDEGWLVQRGRNNPSVQVNSG